MTTLGLAAGATACFGAIALAARELLAAPPGADGARAPAPQDLRGRIAARAERTLARRGWHAALERTLTEAGVASTPGDVSLLVGGASGLGFVLGVLAGNAGLAVVLAAGPPLVARLVLRHRRDARRRAFGDQLVQLLPSLAGSLRAGHSLHQAVELAGSDLPAPAGPELRRVGAEVDLGRDLVDAVLALADRYECEDLRWTASALQVHREVGGDLPRVLDRVADTIRARDHLRRQVRSLTAEGRTSAKVLSIMPVALAALLSVTNPSYLATFTGSAAGLAFLGGAAVLVLVGSVWLRAMTHLEV